MAMISGDVLSKYAVEGYFTTHDLIERTLLERLCDAAPRVKAKACSGAVHLHANYAAPGEPWVIDGILTSAFGEPAFAEFMVSDRLLRFAHAFLGPEIRLGYLGLLTNPKTVDFDLYWHRDVLNLSPTNFVEEVELSPVNWAMQTKKLRWTLALVDESNVRLIPGSHRRWGTDLENEVVGRHETRSLPGERIIPLRAGEAVFYDERIFHRAYTRKDIERFSLFGTWARFDPNEPKKTPIPEMQWMLRAGIRETFPERLRLYYDRFCHVYGSGSPQSPLITHAADNP